MKYNVGDKFIVEIKKVYERDPIYPYELVVGGGVSEKFLDELQKMTGKITEEPTYNDGLETAWKIATMIYKSSYYGGLKGFEVKKYFGCTIDEIYKLPIQEVVKGFKHYEEDQNLDWSRVPVDTPILVRDHDGGKWMCRHFAKYEDGKVYTWKFGGTSYTSHKDDVVEWKQAKLLEE